MFLNGFIWTSRLIQMRDTQGNGVFAISSACQRRRRIALKSNPQNRESRSIALMVCQYMAHAQRLCLQTAYDKNNQHNYDNRSHQTVAKHSAS